MRYGNFVALSNKDWSYKVTPLYEDQVLVQLFNSDGTELGDRRCHFSSVDVALEILLDDTTVGYSR